jgi:group I intron endonuclease
MPRKQKKYHFIYKTTNLINNKFYVGIHSSDVLDDNYLGSGIYLRNSIKKYGRKNHKRDILEFFPDRKALSDREENMVNEEILKDPLCMNLKSGGEFVGMLGYRHSKESLEKISKNRKGKCIGEDNHMFGKKHSSDTIKKIKDNGIFLSGENNPFYGKTHTKEIKEKIRKSHTGKKASEETRKKMRLSKIGNIPKNSKRVEYGGIKYESLSELYRHKFAKSMSRTTFSRNVKYGKIATN